MALFKSWDSKFDRQADFSREQLANEQAFTERMWNQTNDWNLAQWNRENEYNSPASQMERMAMAGINPNDAAAAIAGNDSSSGSAMASVPGSPGTPGAPNASDDTVGLAGQVLGLGTDLYKYLDSGKKNIDADTNQKQTQGDVNKANEKVLMSTKDQIDQDVKQRIWDFDNLNDERKRQMSSITDKAIADKELSVENTKLAQKKQDEVIKNLELLDEDIAKRKEEVRIAQEQVNYWKEQTKLSVSQQEVAQAQKGLLGAETKLANANSALSASKKKEQDIWNTYESDLNSLGIDPRATGDWKMETGKAVGINAKRGTVNKDNVDEDNVDENGIFTNLGKKVDRVRGKMKVRQRSNNHKNPSWH